MSDTPFWAWSLDRLRTELGRGVVSPVEVVDSIVSRIEERRDVNAFITVLYERAAEYAKQCEQKVAVGVTKPLNGVPISLKDNIATAGVLTTAGSPVLRDWIPREDAAIASSVLDAGSVLIGKNNLYEFAFGAAHPWYGETLNPWNLRLTCGGSSNGSAAAVADGQVHGAIGTDTGGSIRIPAAMCGVVGLKPTYGWMSNRGVVPVSAGLDVCGPIARSVDDAEFLFKSMGGMTGSGTVKAGRPRIGLVAPQPAMLTSTSVTEAISTALGRLEAAGLDVQQVELPDLFLVRDVMWTIGSVDAAEYHRHNLVTHGRLYCEKVRRNLMAGAMVPGVDYIRAQRIRRRITEAVANVFRQIDVLLLPSIPMDPYESGQRRITLHELDEDVLQAIMRFTPLANLTGQPALVVPVMNRVRRPPATVQLYGRHGEETLIFEVARQIERSTITFPTREVKAG
jgi:aspartyl-tRNA(Asn)/glutamyl-tRNA(Gln) amidotransferase subunit A